MTDIVLCTQNARWSHASLALRCLLAALPDPLRARACIVERTTEDRPEDVVEALLAERPRIVGLSVSVWNAAPALQVVRLLRAVAPEVTIVLGGPEVSHEIEAQELCTLAHHVVVGEGEMAFAELCAALLPATRPALAQLPPKIIAGGSPDLATLPCPYDLYSDADLQQRVVYVEASRGCPFSCEFCLSSIDDKVRPFPLDAFLAAMQRLLERGLLSFKFIDRTFNLKIDTARRILEFFLDHLRPGLFLHFEMVPDRLPADLRALLQRFPAGTVQLEVGIQTLNPEVSARISRRQDVGRLEDNLRFLTNQTGVHIHADLIVGLPGEDLASFGAGFDRLHALGVHEIQVGILKRLRGTPIVRHTDAFGMVYNPEPPYEVRQTHALSFPDVQRLKRFARYFDLVHNNGRFPHTTALLLSGSSPFAAFLSLSDWLWQETGARHGIALPRLGTLLGQHLVEERGLLEVTVHTALLADFGRDKLPGALSAGIPKRQRRHLLPGHDNGAA
jgi:radical SAM superfamily enzyme YgiQ (UPF0313 family)